MKGVRYEPDTTIFEEPRQEEINLHLAESQCRIVTYQAVPGMWAQWELPLSGRETQAHAGYRHRRPDRQCRNRHEN